MRAVSEVTPADGSPGPERTCTSSRGAVTCSALREHGLRVCSVKGDFEVQAQVTDDPAAIGPCHFVLFCVKTFDTDAAAARLGR